MNQRNISSIYAQRKKSLNREKFSDLEELSLTRRARRRYSCPFRSVGRERALDGKRSIVVWVGNEKPKRKVDRRSPGTDAGQTLSSVPIPKDRRRAQRVKASFYYLGKKR